MVLGHEALERRHERHVLAPLHHGILGTHTHVGSLPLKRFARVFYVSLQSKRTLHVGGLHDPLASPPDTVEALQVLSRAQESGANGKKAVEVAA